MAWWRKSEAQPRDDRDEETVAPVSLTVDIQRGEYVSISGPSGCGKSTLLVEYPLTVRGVPQRHIYLFDGRMSDRATSEGPGTT